MSVPNDATRLLDQLAELRAAATPGPWVERGRSQEPYVGSGTRPGTYGFVCTPKNPADAALIVAAVNALPALVAAVRAGLALADELADELAELGSLNLERANEHRDAGRLEDEAYRLGRSVSYTQCAGRIRAAALAPAPAPAEEEP